MGVHRLTRDPAVMGFLLPGQRLADQAARGGFRIVLEARDALNGLHILKRELAVPVNRHQVSPSVSEEMLDLIRFCGFGGESVEPGQMLPLAGFAGQTGCCRFVVALESWHALNGLHILRRELALSVSRH